MINGRLSRESAATCIRFNKSALRYIVSTDSISTVILSSASWYVEQPDRKTLQREFLATLSKLREAKKNVIVIAPPPNPGGNIDVGECLERRAEGVFTFPLARSGCDFSYDDYRASSRVVIEFLRNIETLDGINVIWPESVMCNHETCAAQIGKTPLYRGTGHIAIDASVPLVRMLHIGDKLDLTLRRSAN